MVTAAVAGPVRIAPQALTAFATALLARAGFAPAQAAEMADLLVWANWRGIESHGVLRIPRYIEMLQTGEVNAQAQLTMRQSRGAVCVLDADRAPGATAMNRAVQLAAERAAQCGIGWCSVRQMSHAGAIGYFVQQLAAQGKLGIAMTASKPLMAYFGAQGEALSSNPLAIGVPMPPGHDAMILDMSTAAVALGKVLAAKDANRPIPEGWGVDAAGASTTDPAKVVALLPMAGAKGSGLSLMIEVLCSLLVGNPNIAPALSGDGPNGFNGMVLAIEPAAFGDASTFLAQAGALATAIHGLAPAPGHDQVLLPGERGHRVQVERTRLGIPVAAGTQKSLLAQARALGVAPPDGWV